MFFHIKCLWLYKCSVNKFWRFENKSWLNIAIDIESDIWYHVSKQWDSAQPLERAGNKNEIYGQNKVSDMAVIGRHTRTLSQMWTSCINYLIFRPTSVPKVKIKQSSGLWCRAFCVSLIAANYSLGKECNLFLFSMCPLDKPG